ncbi:MAG: YHYH protein [Flavobacteriaceae bacterium]|nr:YHYH protein [Flavobacteriaceae bacterium]
MHKIGYTVDGYPVYYKYGYADEGNTLISHVSGYQLKTEER